MDAMRMSALALAVQAISSILLGDDTIMVLLCYCYRVARRCTSAGLTAMKCDVGQTEIEASVPPSLVRVVLLKTPPDLSLQRLQLWLPLKINLFLDNYE